MKHTVVVIGKSHPIADAAHRSPLLDRLVMMSDYANPGLSGMGEVIRVDTNDPIAVAAQVAKIRPSFAVIGSEEPLARGLVDELLKIGVPSVGPTKLLAQLESSKSFTRELLSKHKIPGNPEFKIFRSLDGLPEYLSTKETFVVKPDGLTGGKGVQVFGDHFTTVKEALKYCRELFDVGHRAIVIEEKLDGEEFSYHSFFDGHHIAHTIPVQDHKRARENDTGPNTGGMGSYSCADHLLPFLSAEHVAEAANINRLVGEALLKETGQEYKGILYGGFMRTKDGIRVIEYNARFGDPEVMNLLSLLETDFIEICLAIIEGTLDKLPIKFQNKASVCKYLVPEGYPKKASSSVIGTAIDLSKVEQSPNLGKKLRLYYGAVDEVDNAVCLTDSRSVAVVGIADTLQEAENIAEDAASSVKGKVFHRKDIGTEKLIQKRIDHMEQILGKVPNLPLRRRVG